MTDTKLLEAWCHWVGLEKDPGDDREMMAEHIRAVLAELKMLRKLEQSFRKARIEEYCNVPCYVDEALENIEKLNKTGVK